ncbi:MAG TPA: GNAT family N-acetyltransferase [Cyclobacteriaceae bacterium]|nr:GNAT family N-acetyltransferase [Cyclobacteriaceae bacterium]HRK55112.1 GNAT family N-acetyltransferase [Cyclobacteriaceae bacterium]
MGEISIEAGKVTDLPQVLDLIHELAAYVGFAKEVSNTVEQMEQDGFSNNPIYGLFVARDGQKVIGAAIYYYRYSTWKGKRLYLEDLVVKEGMRKKGIGKLLFEATMKKSLEEKCSGLMWQVLDENTNAIAFYKKYNTSFDRMFINCSLDVRSMKRILKVN